MLSPERSADSSATIVHPSEPTAFSSWQAVADFLRAAWGDPAASPVLRAVAEKIAAAEPTPAGRIARALAHVRREIRALEGPLALGRPPTPPGEVLQAAAGDALARAALLWHLLRGLGLPARPVFTGPRLEEARPGLAAFDRVLVEVGGRCHSVDPPEAVRDRALAEMPLGLTLAPGIVDLEPISPWQPAPEGETSVPEAASAPPPAPKAAPSNSTQLPVQVEFVLDFASPATARAAQVEAALLGPPSVASGKAAPAASTALPSVEAGPPSFTAPAPVKEINVAEPPTPASVGEIKPAAPRRSLREELLERARLHRQASAPPPPPRPETAAQAAPVPTPAESSSPNPAPQSEGTAETPPAQEPATPREDAISKRVPEPPPVSPVAATRPAPRQPVQRASLREELAARAARRPAREPRQEPLAVTRPNPRPQREEGMRTAYDFDPTVRARRSERGGQWRIALMVLGFLAVMALWIFVFLSKRSAP
jgi:hypothetical protein